MGAHVYSKRMCILYSSMKRVFEAPRYYQDGKPYVKASEFTANDKAKIHAAILQSKLESLKIL